MCLSGIGTPLAEESQWILPGRRIGGGAGDAIGVGKAAREPGAAGATSQFDHMSSCGFTNSLIMFVNTVPNSLGKG